MSSRLIMLVLLLALPQWTAGQHAGSPNGSDGQGTLRVVGSLPEGSLSADATPFLVVGSIRLENNQVTRNRVIMRELLFQSGDTLPVKAFLEKAEQSRANLLNTGLFNFVEMQLNLDDLPIATVDLIFVERWYLWALPIVELGERNLNTWLSNPTFSRLNYGVTVSHSNFRGRGETLALLLRHGYRQNYSLGYLKPYFNRAQTLGVGLEGGISMRRELAYIAENNQQLFFSEPGSVVYTKYFINAALIYRPAHFSTHTLRLGFQEHHFADTLLQLNPRFAPGNQPVVPFFVLSYAYHNDHRDIRAYPLRGHYFDVRLTRQGLSLLKNERMDVTSLETSLRKFWELAPRWYAAGGVNARLSEGKGISYFNQQGLGFKGDLVRGFENYVIDGQHFIVLKSNLKFALLPQRTTNIGFVPSPRFSLVHYALYLNLYADAGYVNDRLFREINPLSNRWLGGTGLGLDFVTYYDKVLRMEFSLNNMREAGVFFHLLAPI
jgi:outer membrane protein assembly factor BamA